MLDYQGMAGGDIESLSHRLKRFRAESGLSLSELARKADISKSNLSRAEAGLAVPSAETLRRLAEALGKRPGDLTQAARVSHRFRLPISEASEELKKELTKTGLAPEYSVYVVTRDSHSTYLTQGDVLLVSKSSKPERGDHVLLGDPDPLTIARIGSMRVPYSSEEVDVLNVFEGPYAPEEDDVEVLGVIVERRRPRSALMDGWDAMRWRK